MGYNRYIIWIISNFGDFIISIKSIRRKPQLGPVDEIDYVNRSFLYELNNNLPNSWIML